MKKFRDREQAGKKQAEPRPGHRVFLTPTTKGTQPTLAHLPPKTVKTGKVPEDRVVVEVALHYTSQPLAEVFHWLVPASKLLLQLLELCEEALPDGLVPGTSDASKTH